jgi:hypothetical protein
MGRQVAEHAVEGTDGGARGGGNDDLTGGHAETPDPCSWLAGKLQTAGDNHVNRCAANVTLAAHNILALFRKSPYRGAMKEKTGAGLAG